MKVHAYDLYPKRDPYKDERRDSYLREFYFVDPAILAAELGHAVSFVEMRLRKLGLRKCKNKEGRT